MARSKQSFENNSNIVLYVPFIVAGFLLAGLVVDGKCLYVYKEGSLEPRRCVLHIRGWKSETQLLLRQALSFLTAVKYK